MRYLLAVKEINVGKLHCLDVGCGDSNIIQTSNATFLVDCNNIEQHAHLLPANNQLRGVIITHQHRDHYCGLEYLRKNGYSIQYLIHSPYKRRYNDSSVTIEEWNEFEDHVEFFKSKGTKVYAPYKQSSWEKPYWTIDGLKFWMLGPKESTATSENRCLHNACLVFRTDFETKLKCTFTGDASDTNLADVAQEITNICNDVLHASHHGSLEGANLDFIKACKMRWTIISTACGRYPNVPHPTALKRYKENSSTGVWRTDEDGTATFEY